MTDVRALRGWTSGRRRPGRRRPRSGGPAVGLAGLGACALLGSVPGAPGALLLVGLYVMACASWAVVSRRSWVGRTTRGAATGVLAGGVVLALVGAAVADPVDLVPIATPGTASPSDPVPAHGPASTRSARPTATPSPAAADVATLVPAPAPEGEVATGGAAAEPETGATAEPGTALATASGLTVKGRAPRTGYERDHFGSGWVDVDRNGCDTRNDVLARDLQGVTFLAGTRDCVVLSGTLADPYSGASIAFVRGSDTSTAVQVDHVVALSDAWQKGARGWDTARRTAFANDPLNLLAVDGGLNRQKGDGDTATWLPPSGAFRCAYVARQVGVKHTYGLWVTAAEQAAMVRVLSACPTEPLPVGSGPPPPPPPSPGRAPAATPAPTGRVTEPAPAVVPLPGPAATGPYASCSAARAAGAAPVRAGDPGYAAHLDGDADGVGCE